METKELIKFVKKQMKALKSDMKYAEKHDKRLYATTDYAYAEGAYNAYEVLLKKLKGEN